MKIIVDNFADGKSLFNLLKSHGVQFSIIQKLARKGHINVDGAKVKENIKVKENQTITISNFTENNYAAKAKSLGHFPLNFQELVLYENQDVVVINKPYGIATQGGSGIKVSIDTYASSHGLKLVHRLDLNTSGALILAKTISAARSLTHAFKSHLIEKTYTAITSGIPANNSGVINIKIEKQLISMQERMCISENGELATTHYNVIKTFQQNLNSNSFALMELRPITGKKHQIRVACLHINCPILGDNKYCLIKNTDKKMFLHAQNIFIPKSILGKEIDVTCPLPEHFAQKITELESKIKTT